MHGPIHPSVFFLHRVKFEDCFLYRTDDGIAVDPRNGAALLTKPSRLRVPSVWRRECLRKVSILRPMQASEEFSVRLSYGERPVLYSDAPSSIRELKETRKEVREHSLGSLKRNGLIASSYAIVILAGMMPVVLEKFQFFAVLLSICCFAIRCAAIASSCSR